MKRIIYKSLLTLIGLGIFNFAQAQDSLLLTLEQAIAIGLENNYSIRLSRNMQEQTANNVTYGNAGMLPSVGLNGSYSGGIANTEMQYRGGDKQQVNGAKSSNLNGSIALDWTLFDGLKMFAEYDRLKELNLMAEEQLHATVQRTIASIMNAYYDLISKQLELRATGRILEISRKRLKSAEDLFYAGKASKVDMLSAQVDYSADTASYIQQIALVRTSKIEMNRLLGREMTTFFEVNDSIVLGGELAYADILSKAMENHSDVLLARMDINAATFQLKSIQSGRYPKIAVSTGYNLGRSFSQSGMVEQNKSNTFNYGATISIPLFNGLNLNRQIKNAKLGVAAAELEFDRIKQDVASQVATAYSTYEVNRKLAHFESTNLAIAEESLSISMERYKFGAISAVELRDVQRSYLSAVNRHIVASYNAKVAETALKLLTGKVDWSAN